MYPTQVLVRLLSKRLRKLARRLCKDGTDGSRAWTEAFLDRLVEAAREMPDSDHIGVGGHPLFVENADFGEWLFDMIWLKYDQQQRMEGVYLVAESEWGSKEDVLDDFQKLLVARATVRVMVYDAHNAGDMTECFREHIGAFHGSADDTYVVIAYDEDPDKWWLTFTELTVVEGQPLPHTTLHWCKVCE